jgi:hypothetical chaperone protein
MNYCAIDFGTSNSALAFPHGDGMRLAQLEPGFTSAPDAGRSYGRAAISAYVDGIDGRLMRSIKSILGSDLMEESTEVATNYSVKYVDVVTGYLRRLRQVAQKQTGLKFERVVIGRPVFFVDGDAKRDTRAQATLASAARAAGFKEVAFQFEPIAAALDYESKINSERLVLVADIGGGTSDFSVVRASPERRQQLDRKTDVLANHGVHIAGTDFDRAVNLAAIMPLLGYGSTTPDDRIVPSSIYFELATWHLINTTQKPAKVAELRQMRTMYADGVAHARLVHVLTHRLGHLLAAKAEQAKIEVSNTTQTRIDLTAIEAAMAATFDEPRQARALESDVGRIVAAAEQTARLAGLKTSQIDAVYFTGGSTGLTSLTQRIASRFGAAERVHGDHFASVVSGLGIYARRRFGQYVAT